MKEEGIKYRAVLAGYILDVFYSILLLKGGTTILGISWLIWLLVILAIDVVKNSSLKNHNSSNYLHIIGFNLSGIVVALSMRLYRK